MKRCRVCHVERFDSEFQWANKAKGTRQSICRECKSRQMEKYREALILSRRGLTSDEYDQMLADQGGVCAICKSPETVNGWGKPKRLAVDHDHNCRFCENGCRRCIRGLVCQSCNLIGKMEKDPVRTFAIIDYLDLTWPADEI